MARKRYPVPLDSLSDSDAFVRLPAAGAGMVLRLILHAWHIMPHDMPTYESELRTISRADNAQWVQHKALVLQAVEDWRGPALAYWQKRSASRVILRIAAQRGNAARADARIKQAQATRDAQAPSTFHAMGITPRREEAPRPAQAPARPARKPMVDRY